MKNLQLKQWTGRRKENDMGKWGKRIGYGIGDLGCNLVFSTMASYLMVFYTDVFGITAAAAGTMMLVTKFIDAFTDTGMGLIVDRTNTKWGQGRPYFLVGAVPFAVFTFLTFYIPDFGSGGKLPISMNGMSWFPQGWSAQWLGRRL